LSSEDAVRPEEDADDVATLVKVEVETAAGSSSSRTPVAKEARALEDVAELVKKNRALENLAAKERRESDRPRVELAELKEKVSDAKEVLLGLLL
jgi:uncharacterized membrane protein YdbT with pleckstrin-like domain